MTMSVFVERQNTVKISFQRDAPKVLAYEIHDWIYDTLKLPIDQVVMIQLDNLTRCFYIKVQRESLLQDILERTRGEAPFVFSTGERGTVKLEHAGVGYRVVKLYHLPLEVSSAMVNGTLKPYGTILDSSTEQWSESYRYPTSSGVRSVRILLTRHIPSFLYISGHRVLVVYPGQPPTCAYCHLPGHFKSDCPRKRGIVQTPREIEQSAWTVLNSEREFPVLRHSSVTSGSSPPAGTSSAADAGAPETMFVTEPALCPPALDHSSTSSAVTAPESTPEASVSLQKSVSPSVEMISSVVSEELPKCGEEVVPLSEIPDNLSDEQTLSAEEPHLTASSVSDSEEQSPPPPGSSKRRKGARRRAQRKVQRVEDASCELPVADHKRPLTGDAAVSVGCLPPEEQSGAPVSTNSATPSISWNDVMEADPPNERETPASEIPSGSIVEDPAPQHRGVSSQPAT